MMLRSLKMLVGLVIILMLSPEMGVAQDADLPLETLEVVTVETSHRFEVEVASSDAQRAKGLMYREEMAEDHGMLFVFEAEGERYFWMKDTPLSLDIIFAAEDGLIVRIAERTTPFSEKIIPSRGDARFVLELLGGTAERLGISNGDKLVSPSILEAQ
ncbi:DUF192 domain-containing protein [Roseibium sp.]|uniref:DUF192 domain-containing protein n=1 Tax=Roseibium sp. TaxID=1936156 RepID=UPI003A97AC56